MELFSHVYIHNNVKISLQVANTYDYMHDRMTTYS